MDKIKSKLNTIEEQASMILNNESLGLSYDERINLVKELIRDKVNEILKKYDKN